MPLTVSLLRHAKSSWADPRIGDADRPLNARGRAAAPCIAAWMAKNGIIPDAILCSTAARAKETLALVLPALKPRPKLTYRDDLYLAQADAILAMLRAMPDAGKHVLVIGHNPGLEELAVRLTGSGDKAARQRLSEKFPTAALAVIRFEATSWSKIALRRGKLLHYVTPRWLDRELGNGDD